MAITQIDITDWVSTTDVFNFFVGALSDNLAISEAELGSQQFPFAAVDWVRRYDGDPERAIQQNVESLRGGENGEGQHQAGILVGYTTERSGQRDGARHEFSTEIPLTIICLVGFQGRSVSQERTEYLDSLMDSVYILLKVGNVKPEAGTLFNYWWVSNAGLNGSPDWAGRRLDYVAERGANN